MLEVTDVSKRFGGVQALNGVTLGIEAGEIFGLIGPNGAGKTTLFNVISGVYYPDGGRVVLQGTDITGLKPHEICGRGIARTFQLVQPFAEMTVLDNVGAGRLFGREGREGRISLRRARDEARDLLRFGKLEGREVRRAATLTLSERKRLEMVRALATGPTLLLLDEVMAGLNQAEAEEMGEIVRALPQAMRLTVLFIEHNVRLVTGLCTRLAVLDYGQIIAQGEPEAVVRDEAVIRAYLGDRWARRMASRA
ncbi:MAG: ABC transporter ATP-binding protein [Deltaproteobacteria bacterium]|nr:ABC transporter ATP-binding protein [Deltaproteobacteria bacterium]